MMCKTIEERMAFKRSGGRIGDYPAARRAGAIDDALIPAKR